MSFLKSLRLDGFLSFAPGSEAIALTPLNVLIGPNGSGKSNLIEAVELLHATPTAFAQAIRDGGGVREWVWKGDTPASHARIEAELAADQGLRDLRYYLSFRATGLYTEVTDEGLEESEKRDPGAADPYFYYRYQNGKPAINVREKSGNRTERHLERQSLTPDESVLSQRKDPDQFPELAWVGQRFSRIQTFREWSFGRYAHLRQPQPADLSTGVLLPDSRNLGLLLNQIEHAGTSAEFNRLMSRFLGRFKRFSTLTQGSTIQFFLHEAGLKAPVPATRLSDGTIRFLAILAILLAPDPPPVAAIEEPELGLHPDAVSLLASVLVEASDRMQLILTTHSDVLISALSDRANSVLVAEHRDGTHLDRLDSQKLRYWLDKDDLGALWRTGEIGGNP